MTDNMDLLGDIAEADVEELIKKDADYGSSWKKRGGIGAYMMLARKWDRIENLVESFNWDIFAACTQVEPLVPGKYIKTGLQEGVLDDIRDLRRYLLLVESEVIARGFDELDECNKCNGTGMVDHFSSKTGKRTQIACPECANEKEFEDARQRVQEQSGEPADRAYEEDIREVNPKMKPLISKGELLCVKCDGTGWVKDAKGSSVTCDCVEEGGLKMATDYLNDRGE